MRPETPYEVNGVKLERIKNRNEIRVLKLLPDILKEQEGWEPDYIDVQDIYALTLNNLPPYYVQPETIILKKNVKVDDDAIRQALLEAIGQVRDNPNHD